jgi:hypothetical protein
MNSDNKLSIKSSVETIIKRVRNSINDLNLKNDQIELNQEVLLDYYNLITTNISDQATTIYILHLISREINKSNSILEKKILLSLLPEFFIPFFTTDISVTYPYLSRILTTIQSNMLSGIAPAYIGEIFKKIIFYLFNDEEGKNKNEINKDLFETCQGFCLYNMKLMEMNNQLVGIICLNILLTELDYSFLNKNNFAYYIWDKISLFLDSKFTPKSNLLKYLYDFISKFKIPFKPYVDMAIYKILEYLDNDDPNIRKASLNILGLLISFYPNEIEPIKNSIIKLLTILHNDKDDNIRNKSIYIYNKIKKQYNSSSHSIKPIKNKNNNKNKNKKHNLYFYDFGYDNWFNKKEIYTNKDIYKNNTNINTNNIDNNNGGKKRLFSRKPTRGNLSLLYDPLMRQTIKTEPRHSKGDIGDLAKFAVKVNNKNENKRYYEDGNIRRSHKIINGNESMGFRELLKMVKGRSDNKCVINNNFSNLRDEIKKNNNGLSQIRKLKNEKTGKYC